MNITERWYCVDRNGIATLCKDEADAREEAADNAIAWPHNMPYVVARMVPSAAVEHMQGCIRTALLYLYLGPTAPECSGSAEEWVLAIKSLQAALELIPTPR